MVGFGEPEIHKLQTSSIKNSCIVGFLAYPLGGPMYQNYNYYMHLGCQKVTQLLLPLTVDVCLLRPVPCAVPLSPTSSETHRDLRKSEVYEELYGKEALGQV